MIEVRPFEGTPEELSDFVVSTWKASYGGSIAVPNWSADYFRWQLRLDEPDSQRRVVAAYEGTKLAGTVIFVPLEFELLGERLQGAHSSWLSVSNDFRRRGVGKKLQAGTVAECREQGLEFQLGYIYQGSSKSVGPRFWQKQRADGRSAGPRVGFWARVLDPSQAAQWNVSGLERFLTKLVSPFVPQPQVKEPSDGIEIRAFRPEDTAACVELANRASAGCDLRLMWSERMLGHYLQGFGDCQVLTENGQPRGFIGFHRLIFSGRIDAPIGVLDQIAVAGLNPSNCAQLLNSVLVELQNRGAVVALKLRTGDYPAGFFRKWGWVPRLADSQMLFSWSGEPRDVARIRRSHVVWR